MSINNEITKSSSFNSEDGNENKISMIEEEEENKFINNFFSEAKIENNKFIKPNHKLIWDYCRQNTFHFKQDIDRVWLIIRNFDLLTLINNKGHYPCVPTKGNDTWKVGNEFKGNLCGTFPFLARVEKNVNLPEIKKIKWLFNIQNNNFIMIKFELFKNTEDNTCVLFCTTKSENNGLQKMLEQKFREMQLNELLLKVEELLESEPINLFQYESGIINAKMEDIWKIVTDFNKLTAIAPNNKCLPNINISNMKQGEKVISSIVDNNDVDEVEITLLQKEDRKGWNKWICIILISSVMTKKHPKHCLLFQLTKINENECQLTFISKYHEPIETKRFRDISNKKKYLLLSIKDYFDNFYCPSFSN